MPEKPTWMEAKAERSEKYVTVVYSTRRAGGERNDGLLAGGDYGGGSDARAYAEGKIRELFKNEIKENIRV